MFDREGKAQGFLLLEPPRTTEDFHLFCFLLSCINFHFNVHDKYLFSSSWILAVMRKSQCEGFSNNSSGGLISSETQLCLLNTPPCGFCVKGQTEAIWPLQQRLTCYCSLSLHLAGALLVSPLPSACGWSPWVAASGSPLFHTTKYTPPSVPRTKQWLNVYLLNGWACPSQSHRIFM